jgi:xanthine dehydrogenase accessory protein XdhC
VLTTVTEALGSAPRDAGARMVVWTYGQAGTIGGGNLEFRIIREAHAVIDGETQAGEADYPLGPILGQCCGGRVRVRLELLDESHVAWLKGELRAEENAKTPLLLFGAGHVGKAIAEAVAPLPFALSWFDTRPGYFRRAMLVKDPREMVAAAPEQAFYLIVTHNHDLDYEVTRAVLARADAGYCGLIGSASKRARFERQLRDDGIAENQIEHLVCPIGASIAIKSKEPVIIAAATVAEMLSVRESIAASAEHAHVG